MTRRARIVAVLATVIVVSGAAAAVLAVTGSGTGKFTSAPPATATPTAGSSPPGTPGVPAVTAAPVGPGQAAGEPGATASPVPPKIPAGKATGAQVEEAFVAMSAARLCAIQGEAFQSTGDLEDRAAVASKVALSTAQVKSMTKRLTTDKALAKKVAQRFRAACKPVTR